MRLFDEILECNEENVGNKLNNYFTGGLKPLTDRLGGRSIPYSVATNLNVVLNSRLGNEFRQ